MKWLQLLLYHFKDAIFKSVGRALQEAQAHP